jgi:hypothetical protein
MDDAEGVEAIVAVARDAAPKLTIVARARDARHAQRLYELGATDAVPETMEASLQLSEAVLVEIGVPMGLVIASIHERRDEFRAALNRPNRSAAAAAASGARRRLNGAGNTARKILHRRFMRREPSVALIRWAHTGRPPRLGEAHDFTYALSAAGAANFVAGGLRRSSRLYKQRQGLRSELDGRRHRRADSARFCTGDRGAVPPVADKLRAC